MAFCSKIKSTIKDLQPCAAKVALDVAKGYAFGCVFGAFTASHKPLTSKMHTNGKTFAKMCGVYSATEIVLQKVRKTDDIYNSSAAGAAAGFVGCTKQPLAGASIFAGYSALSHFLGKTQ
ncbi:mitochondrial import inner membrane translocase subunit TIM22 [Enteropsectra breve]|nr:mitochondrial import inner membrane translocase subunit TIM22 [Enteropsectra breve]